MLQTNCHWMMMYDMFVIFKWESSDLIKKIINNTFWSYVTISIRLRNFLSWMTCCRTENIIKNNQYVCDMMVNVIYFKKYLHDLSVRKPVSYRIWGTNYNENIAWEIISWNFLFYASTSNRPTCIDWKIHKQENDYFIFYC